MRMMKSLSRLLLGVSLATAQVLHAQPHQSQGVDSAQTSKGEINRLLLHGATMSAPIVAAGLLQTLNNQHVRELRFAYYPHFRHHYDDYLQFAPLAGQLGLRLAGVKGITDNPLQMVVADALASASMLAITSAIKYTARVERPDRSSRNSFPSGHTAMAFTSAELLGIEYGSRYPWIRPVGYAVASATGLGRLLNNRHWVGDVITGAGLGILSAHIGYWAADRIFGRSRRQLSPAVAFPSTGLLLYLPIEASALYTGRQAEWYASSRSLGLGAEYTPEGWPLYLQTELQLALQRIYRQSTTAVDPSAEAKALCLHLGVGRDLPLWYNLGINLSVHGTLRYQHHERVLRSDELSSVSLPRLALGVGLEFAPHWRFTRHLGIRVPFGTDYVPSGIQLNPVAGDAIRLRGIAYHISTSLEVHF